MATKKSTAKSPVEAETPKVADAIAGLDLGDVELVRQYIRGDGRHVVTIAARPLGD